VSETEDGEPEGDLGFWGWRCDCSVVGETSLSTDINKASLKLESDLAAS
jgi:hypothetical protein